MRILLALGVLMPLTSRLQADVEVRVAGERVSLHAVSAPVSEILDKLARQTGMRVTYDASPPRHALTATLEDRAPAEVVLSVLEGLGLNYALVMDRSGAHVDQLLILGALSTAAPGLSPAAAPPAPRAMPPGQELESPQSVLGIPEADNEEEDDQAALAQLDAERQAEEAAQAAPAPVIQPAAPPQYPSSAFTPKLSPLPAPAPRVQPTPQPRQ